MFVRCACCSCCKPKKMKLTVTTMSDEIFVFDVSDDLELENFKVLCELESAIPARELLLIFNGRPLLDNAGIRRFVLRFTRTVQLRSWCRKRKLESQKISQVL